MTEQKRIIDRDPQISIIVPIYNGEKYLQPCIDSIINQTFENWELILVDDGSTDGSATICDEYALQDSRIRVLHKSNSGQAQARNDGMRHADGCYISFVDCDDWLEPDMYENMMDAMLTNKADIVVCGYAKEYVSHRKAVNADGTLSIYKGYQALRLILEGKIGSFLCFMLFSRKVMKEPMADQDFFEDHATIFKWFSHAGQVVTLHKAFYHYRQLEHSRLHTCSIEKYICYFKAIKERYYYVRKNGLIPEWKRGNHIQYIRSCIKLAKDLARASNYSMSHRKLILEVRDELKLLLPVKCWEIGLKNYFRLRLLMANINFFVYSLRASSVFQCHKLYNKEKLFVGFPLRPRILFLVSRFLDGGIDAVLIDYIQVLSASGKYEVSLAIEQGMDELEVFLSKIPAGIDVYHLVENERLMKWRKRKITEPLPLSKKIYDEGLLAPIRRHIITRDLKKLAAQNDVIIDFDCCSYSLMKGITIPKIAWFHFSFEEMMRQNKHRMMRISRNMRSYDKIVTISKAMFAEGIQLFPQLGSKLCIIYNAKDREELLMHAQEAVDNELIRQHYILAVERLEESQKDLTTLLKAYQLLKQKYNHREKLYLLGKGQSENELRQLANALGIESDVEFLGFTSNPYPWMKHARLLAHSAKLEGLPTVLIEGLMLDKLMVATDCPTGPREILDDGRAGMLVPVGDAQAMAKAMHRMLTEKDLQAEIAENVKRHRIHFMYEETIREFDDMINNILRK